jgi:membrane-bound lytic murein transglycosylase B
VLDALATLGFRYPPRARFFRRELENYLLLAESESLDLAAIEGSYAGAMGIPQFIPSSYREYAVDFDGDGRRDLIGSVADAIGSVASYLGRHGWVAGAPVAVRASASGAEVAALVRKGIKPHSSLATLERAGVHPQGEIAGVVGAAALIELEGAQGTEHWIGFDNFYVITRYNHSQLYAMAVHQLASEIAERRGAGG